MVFEMNSQTIGAGRKACQASPVNSVSLRERLELESGDGMQPTLHFLQTQRSLITSTDRYASWLSTRVNDIHHARSRKLSPSRVFSRLRGNIRYSTCYLSRVDSHMPHARTWPLVRQP